MCDGKWEEHVTLYEDEQERRELGKPVGEHFYPLADVPDIQAEYIRSDIILSSGVSAPLSDLVPCFPLKLQISKLGFVPIVSFRLLLCYCFCHFLAKMSG